MIDLSNELLQWNWSLATPKMKRFVHLKNSCRLVSVAGIVQKSQTIPHVPSNTPDDRRSSVLPMLKTYLLLLLHCDSGDLCQHHIQSSFSCFSTPFSAFVVVVSLGLRPGPPVARLNFLSPPVLDLRRAAAAAPSKSPETLCPL